MNNGRLAGAAPIVLVTLAACVGAARPADPAGGAAQWDAMDSAQREAYMRSTVLPRMKELFLEFDSHSYPKMDCVPCHPRDRSTQGWRMPNPDLLLDPACRDGAVPFAHGSESYAIATRRMNAFMVERVGPTMAALLGRRPYDATTRDGFDCFGCHTAERPRALPMPRP